MRWYEGGGLPRMRSGLDGRAREARATRGLRVAAAGCRRGAAGRALVGVTVCLLISLLGSGSPAVAQAVAERGPSFAPALEAGLDSLVTAWLADHEVIGLQVAVGTRNGQLWTRGYGLADLEQDVPVTAETRFRTASIDKWMTATAALRLVEAGKLDLDAPVQDYCSPYPRKRWPVTTRHLLGHRGGVRHYWGANDKPRETPEQRAELQGRREEERAGMMLRHTTVLTPLDRFKEDSLLFEPGTDFRYTSHGFRLVGCVLRGAADTPYRELMRELVFQPAGMEHTRDDDAYAIIPARARGYVRRGGELRRSRFRDVSENLPAGGHVSTAADLVRFALAWSAGELVGEESRRAMTAPEPGESLEDRYYGYGINVVAVPEVPGGRVFAHSGGQDGTRTLLVLVPEPGVALALMSNDEDFPDARGLVLQLIQAAASR